MEADHKKILKAVVLELRHMLEGYYDGSGWHAGDLERRLNALGVWRDRNPLPADELAGVSPADINARKVVDAYLALRDEAGVGRDEAVAEFVRETAYTWTNRLLALRCMEVRELIDEVIVQKQVYGGRSLEHNRLAQRHPELCVGEDDGLFATLNNAFATHAEHLPLLFDPHAPGIALRPSVAALKRAVALLSGTETVRNQEPATNDVFRASDAFGWAYQYWNTEEKNRVFEKVRTQEGAKIEGAEIIAATCIYTEPYMVKFLVQNSLGALWMQMHPASQLCTGWQYYVSDVKLATSTSNSVRDITFLDPACGSGHFLVEAFDLFYAMYIEEGKLTDPAEICAAILGQNLNGIDIDERAVQIALLALFMKAREKAPDFVPQQTNLISTNVRLTTNEEHLVEFFRKHPEDTALKPALNTILEGLVRANELGSLLLIEEPVEKKLTALKNEYENPLAPSQQALWAELQGPVQGSLPIGVDSYEAWRVRTLGRIREHFSEQASGPDLSAAFFGTAGARGVSLVEALSRRYDVVATNPPYMGSKNMPPELKAFVNRSYRIGKRDLYAAFIERCLMLVKEHGKVAMVTLNSWFSQGSFALLREKLLKENCLTCAAQLGRHAFSEADPPGFAALFVLQASTAASEHEILGFELPNSMAADLQATLLRRLTSGNVHFKVRQCDLQQLPRTPILVLLPSRFIEILSSRRRLADYAAVPKGLTTADNDRFLRFFWEEDVGGRWVPYAKGGAYRKWAGQLLSVVDYENNGARLRASGKAVIRNSKYYGSPGLTYTEVARGSFGVRVLDKGVLFDARSPGIFATVEAHYGLLAVLNSRLIGFLFRQLSPGILLDQAYAPGIPVPCLQFLSQMNELGIWAVNAKRLMVASEPTEMFYRTDGTSASVDAHALESLLLSVESHIDTSVGASFNLKNDETEFVFMRVGLPVGCYPLIQGYDRMPDVPAHIGAVPEAVAVTAAASPRRQMSSQERTELMARLKRMYESGPGEQAVETDSLEEIEEDEEEEETSNVANRPVPAESFLEELSRNLQIHPISLYWLLKEGKEKCGWKCPKEQLARAKSSWGQLLLRLLGYRWPKEVELGDPLPAWADSVDVVPLTEGAGTKSLVVRMRDCFAAVFQGDGAMIEREFNNVVGLPLGEWLATEFFGQHVSQFKKRPIGWQLQSIKSHTQSKPAFACIVYYHRLTAQTLTTIQSQYVRPLRQRYESEMRGIESLPQAVRSDRQQDRLRELMDLTPELRTFDDALDTLSRTGFGPEELHPQLRQYAIEDAILCLKSQWLQKLSATIGAGPGKEWQWKAKNAQLHSDFDRWMVRAMSMLHNHCSSVGPKAPAEETLKADPTATVLAAIISEEADRMVSSALELACAVWWKPLDEAVLAPLRRQIKEARDELKELRAEDITDSPDPHIRRKEIEATMKALREAVKHWQRDLGEKTDKAEKLREEILAWSCPEAQTWEAWLASQSMYDAISSVDGLRQAPTTVSDFVSQESAYFPDGNDGVRVNIAPLQKAGLLAADVLASKDVGKAIADRGEWRAEERRWCREGKLPHPGWWLTEKSHVSG